MTDYGIPFQHHETDRLLTAFIDTYNSTVAEGQPFPWINLWVEEAKWTLPHQNTSHDDRQGRAGLAGWAKETIGSRLRDRRFIEKRRLIQGNAAAWEGTWEGGNTPSGEPATLPLAMVIQFDQDGKVRSLCSYYDSAHFQ
jgi:SnoaL-like domain